MAPMDLARAREITDACAAHFFQQIGFEQKHPPSLAEYSLQEMLDAHRLVRAANDDADATDGTRTIHATCDDRYLAALYVAYHYEGSHPADCEAIATAQGRAVVLINLADVQPTRATG